MIEYDDNGDITRVTHEHDADLVPAVAQNAVRHQLAGRTGNVAAALAELDIPQLRQLAQACAALTSAAAQRVVFLAVDQKRKARE